MDSSGARRYALLEMLAGASDGVTLSEAADRLSVDERTVRRDVEALQDLFALVEGVNLVRGKLCAVPARAFAHPLGDAKKLRDSAKAAMARAAVRRIQDGAAVVLTAGTSTLAVAAELRRAQVMGERPRDPIVFTNSLPALLELVAGGISTGVVGEVYSPPDRAFHTHEVRTRFHASLAVVGASGIILEPAAGGLSLCSDRIEEAAFMRQLLAPIPEILVVAEAAKIGKHHPWSFTSDGLLLGKRVHIVTTPLQRSQSDALAALVEGGRRAGMTMTYEEVAECAE